MASTARIAWIVCWVPLAGFTCLMFFALAAFWKVGHWPIYSRPDPSELRMPLLYAASVLAYPASLLALVIGLITFAAAPTRWSRGQGIVFLVGAAAWVLLIPQIDRLFNWLID